MALTDAFLGRIEDVQPLINAFITVTPNVAHADARRADEARESGKALPLDGLPIAVKDNIDVAGVRTTVASRFFEHDVVSDDAEVVRRLRAAGAVVLGKAALHEFVFGATTNNPPPFGACRNPWATDRIPGGSSGGSGAALAADLCIGALGSDTGGSVRIPASLNGVSGLRPTFGVVSNHGAFHVGWWFDTVGPMARSVTDVARMFAHMVAHDPRDPWAVIYADTMSDPLAGLHGGVEGIRIGVPKTFFFEGLDGEIESLVRSAADTFANLGAEVAEIDVPCDASICHAAATIIRADALALHRERYDTHPELFGEDIRRRLELAAEITGEAVSRSLLCMREWQRTVRDVFAEVDIVLSPTTNAVAPEIDASESIETTWNLTYLTYPWSLAHVPALSIPCGFTAEGLPVGVQLSAGQLQEPILLRAGATYQHVTDWHRRRPAFLVPSAA